MKKFNLFVLIALLCNASAFAGNISLKNRVGLGAGLGAAIPLANTVFKNSASTGLSFEGHADYYLSDAFGLELAFNRLNYKSAEPNTNSFTLGVNYRFMANEKLTPVAGIAFGTASTSDSPNANLNYDYLAAIGKIGLDYSICPDFMVGLAVKYAWVIAEKSGAFSEHGLVPQVNFTYFFPLHAAKNTTEAKAAPAAATAAAVDGDDDEDGVLNSIDKCANTPNGTKVNSFGCALDQKVEFTVNIQFEPGKSTIKPKYNSELAKMATLLKEHTDVKAEIQGYTDSSGNKDANVKLSAARAKSVETYLVKLGVDAKRVSSNGYGPDSPIADNKTKEGRTKNRRVVAALTSNK